MMSVDQFYIRAEIDKNYTNKYSEIQAQLESQAVDTKIGMAVFGAVMIVAAPLNPVS